MAEGMPTEVGKIGTSTATKDYKPTLVKSEIERYYRTKKPSVKKVAIVFSEVKEVTNEEYKIETQNFIKIPPKSS
jgi:hypothetical protein